MSNYTFDEALAASKEKPQKKCDRCQHPQTDVINAPYRFARWDGTKPQEDRGYFLTTIHAVGDNGLCYPCTLEINKQAYDKKHL